MAKTKRYKPSDITTKIEEVREQPGFKRLRSRWEEDYSFYRMNEYDAGEGYQSYTSNRPRTTADKIVAYLSEAAMVVRASFNSGDPESRDQGTNLEKFFRGCVRMANDRLNTRMAPSLQDQFAWHIAVRGWYAGRAMFNKTENGMTKCEIEPWDPLHSAWKHDEEGLLWLSRVHRRTPDSIEHTFGIKVNASDKENDAGIEVFEYIDREVRCVIAHDKFLVKPEYHMTVDSYGEPSVPGFVGFVGPQPFVQPEFSEDITWEDIGESVFSQIRGLIGVQNKTMSDWMTLVRRAVRHPLILKSRDGKFRLMDDPYREGANIHLKEGEEMELAPEMRLLADAGAFIGSVNGEMQQGTLPDVVFGDIKFQLSGFAANILRSGARHQIQHRMRAMEDAFRSVFNILRYQYQSNGYGTVRFQGVAGELKQFFDQDISPEDISKAGHFDVKFKNSMGLEDPARYTTAQMLREGPVPLAPDSYIWDELLDVEDPEAWRQEIFSQQGMRAEPKALAYNMFESLMENQRPIEAQFYFDHLKRTLTQEQREEFIKRIQFMQALQQFGMGQPPGQPGEQGQPGQPQQQPQQPPGPPGPPPSARVNNAAVPGSAIGYDQYRTSPPPNNTRAPGEPRPGARSENQQAADAGISINRG